MRKATTTASSSLVSRVERGSFGPGYKKVGPLLISTERRGTADGKPMQLSFSDVSVKVTGSDSWINAQ